nr:uncharacterized protein LOC112020751 [Quercus suber]
MPGINLRVITHRLNVFPSSKPVRQKKRVFALERDKAIKEEVQKLTTAHFIREVYYPDWLANVVMYQTTNNEVEYEALLKGLELAKSIEAGSMLVLGDSQLVIGQVNGTCEVKEDRMKRYLKKVLRFVKKFKEANFVQIPREEDIEADTLAKEASTNEAMDKIDEI